MTFEPQNDLERSLIRAATDPAHRPQFYRNLIASDVFIIQHGKAAPQRHKRVTISEPTNIQIQKIEVNGQLCIPVFSSLARL